VKTKNIPVSGSSGLALHHRIMRFLRLPARQKLEALERKKRLIMERIPHAVRLPSGVSWMARHDHMGSEIQDGVFEKAETKFLTEFIQPGMTVLDIGANQGYYSVLASQRVGRMGKVVAFEPSPRERKKLLRNIKLNRGKNVLVEKQALGSENSEVNLFLAQEWFNGCNSLRPPALNSQLIPVRVPMMRLDDWLLQRSLDRIDLIKLDVEGGELDVLKGAVRLLEGSAPPVLLVEVSDMRTKPWGYRAKEIVEFLCSRGYEWFELSEDGIIQPAKINCETHDTNLVAVPLKRPMSWKQAPTAFEKGAHST